jgi:hypothetical protein
MQARIKGYCTYVSTCAVALCMWHAVTETGPGGRVYNHHNPSTRRHRLASGPKRKARGQVRTPFQEIPGGPDPVHSTSTTNETSTTTLGPTAGPTPVQLFNLDHMAYRTP